MGLRTILGLKKPKAQSGQDLVTPDQNSTTFYVATMNHWYSLAKRHPDYLKPGNCLLKDYGVMRCMEFIEAQIEANRGHQLKILEFGHGFNPAVMTHFQDKAEVWGADRPQGLSYFNDEEWPARFEQKVKSKCPNVRFIRALVGETEENFPTSYFDLIYSISVLEEMPFAAVGKIMTAAERMLRPGGFLFGTYDVRLNDFQSQVNGYAAEHRSAGLSVPVPPDGFDWNEVLIENPASVMLHYMGGEPSENRNYWGHFGTIFTAAQKAL